jgi:hypothetical protein
MVVAGVYSTTSATGWMKGYCMCKRNIEGDEGQISMEVGMARQGGYYLAAVEELGPS